MGYAIFAFIVCFLLVASALFLGFYREMLGRRLASVIEPRADTEVRTISRFREVAASLGLLAGSLHKVVPKSEAESSVVQKRLVRAGFRGESALHLFYASKALTPVLFCVIVVATGLYHWNPLIVFGLALVFGYLVPDYTLDHLIRARGDQIRAGLPDVLDLLVVCLEAGLSLDQAVLRAVDELRASHPAVADELGLVALEVRAGRPRAAAWRGLSERTDLEPVRLLVSILVQADQFGTGISKTLRIHSDTMRTRTKQRVEELAAKTSVKMIFPLVLFIFPSFFVVLLGPAFILISETLQH